MSKVVVCPRCGAAVTEAQNGCPNCGTVPGIVWPPAVLAEPPKAEPPPVRLLTGRVWLDETLGMGLFGLWLFGLQKASWLIVASYFAYVVRLPLSQEPMPYYVPWLGASVPALAILGGSYAVLHRFFPKIGRGFGQNTLIGVGMTFVVFLWVTLLP